MNIVRELPKMLISTLIIMVFIFVIKKAAVKFNIPVVSQIAEEV